MIGRITLVAALTVGGAACVQQGQAEPALCGVAAHTADTVLAYPNGMACVGAVNVTTGQPFGHVIVVSIPCGVLVPTRGEDDFCVRTTATGRIIPLSSFDQATDVGYVGVDV